MKRWRQNQLITCLVVGSFFCTLIGFVRGFYFVQSLRFVALNGKLDQCACVWSERRKKPSSLCLVRNEEGNHYPCRSCSSLQTLKCLHQGP